MYCEPGRGKGGWSTTRQRVQLASIESKSASVLSSCLSKSGRSSRWRNAPFFVFHNVSQDSYFSSRQGAAMAYFPEIDKIRYEGPDSTNSLSFRHYNPDETVEGKTMKEHLRFAVCYW